MKIGILSDTHGNTAATAKAGRIFRADGVASIFHCGDVGGMDVLAELAGKIPVHVVQGNVDLYSDEWKFFPTNIGVQLHGRFGNVSFTDLHVALLHGDDSRRLHRVVNSGEYDLVLSGHTHETHDFMVGETRCLNPGSAGRGNPSTCAVLDLDSGMFSIRSL